MALDRIRFADGLLDNVGYTLSASHARAADYVCECPALAVLVCQRLGSHVTFGERDAFATLTASGPRLRDVLAAYGAPMAVRKLPAHALRHKDGPTLREISKLSPSTLSQVIPVDSQRVWLDAIGQWMVLAPARRRCSSTFSVEWIARRMCEDLSRFEQIGALTDFVGRGGGQINPEWSWRRAMRAVENWHLQLRDEEALRRLAASEREAATFDTVICKAPLPDQASVASFDFYVLRTRRHLREEGHAMHHCVASYAEDVRRGKSAVVSVRRDGVNVATLEIDNAGVVRQLKAHCNQAVSASVRSACDQFALRHWKASPIAAAA